MTIQLNFFVHILGDLAWPEDMLVPHGEELAWILYEGLKSRGVDAKEPEWCDYEYSIDCVEADFTFRLTTGIEHMDDSHSIWYLQPTFPRVARKNVDKALLALKDLLEVANEVLAQSEKIREVRWYPTFDEPEILALMPVAKGPVFLEDFEDRLPDVLKWEFKRRNFIGWFFPPKGFLPLLLMFGVIATFPSYSGLIAAICFWGTIILNIAFWIIMNRWMKEEILKRSEREGGS